MIRVLLLLAAGCGGVSSGTFVGNPDMTVRIRDRDLQMRGGALDASGVSFPGCEDGLGSTTVIFDGAESRETIALPASTCGLFFAVLGFEVTFEDAGELTTIVAEDFDLLVPEGFSAVAGGRYVLQLGDDAWLADLAERTEAGVVRLDGSDPELEAVFFDGLLLGSEVFNEGQTDTTVDFLAE
jgi:hypothetical protein